MCFLNILFVLFAVALATGYQVNNGSSNGVNGFGYELMIERMDYLETSMKESQTRVQRELQESHIETKKLGDMVLRELREFKSIFNTISSCRKTPTKESGIYKLAVLKTAFDVYCEQNLYGGGWIVIQNRFDGSVDFYRKWKDYRNGFGSMEGEFWIGLEKIYLLTSSKTYELMVHLEGFDGVVKYAYYRDFEIGNEQEQYKLNTLTLFNDTAGDSLDIHRDEYFCTHDRDNEENLAVLYHAGWWHGSTYYTTSNLNGKYANMVGDDTMNWRTFTDTEERQGLKVSKMMIREV